jgi:hypothetical protein
MTYDEARVITSDYDLEFPEPLADMVIDAGPPREGGRAETGAVCIAGKLNDSIKIKPRSQPRSDLITNGNVSSISNGQGNARYKCTDGDGSAANCAFITAHCNGCSAVPSELNRRKHLHRLIYTTRAICSEPGGEPLLISYGRAWQILLAASQDINLANNHQESIMLGGSERFFFVDGEIISLLPVNL